MHMFNKKIKELEYKNNYYRNQIEELNVKVSSLTKELTDLTDKHNSIINDYEEKIKQLLSFLNTKDSSDSVSISENMIITEEMKHILELVDNDAIKLVFVHGSAGTGKSTLLKYICAQRPKDDYVLLAPTGIAAMNIDGATIHSFFQIPPANIYPNDNSNVTSLVKEKLENVNLIIIDEISMVRADLFDRLNSNLQYARNNNEFFGGVKLLLIGDLYQLPPILQKQNYIDYEKLGYNKDHTFFFFSNAINDYLNLRHKLGFVELSHIFRQSDKEFIEILQKCRLGRVDDITLDYLKKRFIPTINKEVINLVTTNALADNKNQNEYQKLLTEEKIFIARTTGNYETQNANNLPAPLKITLKIGTQVIITANNGKYYKNGTVGTITAISDNGVTVNISKENRSVLVTPYTWEMKEYDFDSNTKSFILNQKGSYTQIPLKYGWAITIHKSQGLTLENVAINFGNGTFCTGQGYVALSRVRSVDGLYFLSPLKKQDFKADEDIEIFLEKLSSL